MYSNGTVNSVCCGADVDVCCGVQYLASDFRRNVLYTVPLNNLICSPEIQTTIYHSHVSQGL